VIQPQTATVMDIPRIQFLSCVWNFQHCLSHDDNAQRAGASARAGSNLRGRGAESERSSLR